MLSEADAETLVRRAIMAEGWTTGSRGWTRTRDWTRASFIRYQRRLLQEYGRLARVRVHHRERPPVINTVQRQLRHHLLPVLTGGTVPAEA